MSYEWIFKYYIEPIFSTNKDLKIIEAGLSKKVDLLKYLMIVKNFPKMESDSV